MVLKSHRAGVLVMAVLALSVIWVGRADADVVLGSKDFATHGWGWGSAHPNSIFNGGDPSGLVKHIRWKQWGEEVAIGFGLNALFKPSGGYYRRLARVKLRASRIRRCRGRRAYTKLMIRFPRHPGGRLGPWRLWSGVDSICGPPY
jgi:hypothetical protein